MEVAGEQPYPATVVAAAGPSAGSTGNTRRNSDSRHRQRTDRTHSIGRTARCSRSGSHSLLQYQECRTGLRRTWWAGRHTRRSYRRRSIDLHAARNHRSYAAAGSP
jgi:hypothetical protein